MSVVVLLTGPPGIGKTTIVRRVLDLAPRTFAGFYTEEIREEGHRTGFEVVTTDGKRALLATKCGDLSGEPNVGSYVVNTAAIDLIAVPAMMAAARSGRIVVVDEIGPMELLAQSFRSAIHRILSDGRISMVGTVVERPYNFADSVKKHSRSQIIHVTHENRYGLAEFLIQLITSDSASCGSKRAADHHFR